MLKCHQKNGNVTVTFGPYFKDHKLNKNIELTVDVKWEPDNRLADTTQELDLTVLSYHQKIDPLEGPTPGEMVTKWVFNQQRTLNKFTGGLV